MIRYSLITETRCMLSLHYSVQSEIQELLFTQETLAEKVG